MEPPQEDDKSAGENDEHDDGEGRLKYNNDDEDGHEHKPEEEEDEEEQIEQEQEEHKQEGNFDDYDPETTRNDSAWEQQQQHPNPIDPTGMYHGPLFAQEMASQRTQMESLGKEKTPIVSQSRLRQPLSPQEGKSMRGIFQQLANIKKQVPA